MNANQNTNFQYIMPEDEDEDFDEDAGGDEMVDMEDDEAQPENDQ